VVLEAEDGMVEDGVVEDAGGDEAAYELNNRNSHCCQLNVNPKYRKISTWASSLIAKP